MKLNFSSLIIIKVLGSEDSRRTDSRMSRVTKKSLAVSLNPSLGKIWISQIKMEKIPIRESYVYRNRVKGLRSDYQLVMGDAESEAYLLPSSDLSVILLPRLGIRDPTTPIILKYQVNGIRHNVPAEIF